MSTSSLGLGLIGCGGYARLNLEALARAQGLHLAAAYDLDAARAAETCAKYGGRAVGSLDELLRSTDVAAVIVSTPNRQHCADTLAALAAGKHVFVNIPVTLSTDEARTMIARARDCGRVLMAGANHRKNPAVLALRDTLAAGAIGVPHQVQSSVSSPTAYQLAAGSWRGAAQEAPLLPFSQMGIIALEVALMLWGAPETVAAFIAKRDAPTQTPDLGTVIARYADGRTLTLACSYVSYKSYWITFAGSRGTATWDRLDGNCLRVVTDAGTVRTPYASPDEQLDELHEFRDCILGGREPDAGAECIYNLAEFYRAIGASIAAGAAVRFNPWQG